MLKQTFVILAHIKLQLLAFPEYISQIGKLREKAAYTTAPLQVMTTQTHYHAEMAFFWPPGFQVTRLLCQLFISLCVYYHMCIFIH